MAFQTPEEYLEYYYEKYGSYRVQLLTNKIAHKWVLYGTKEYKVYKKELGNENPNNRERMVDEIVLDIEGPKVADDLFGAKEKVIVFETAKEVSDRLRSVLKLSYSKWWSGGTGIHIHTFFPELSKYNKYDRDNIKKILLKKIGYGFLTRSEDKGKVDVQNTPFIQLECAKHRKGGTKILIEENYLGDNKLPEDVLKEFAKDKRTEGTFKPIEFKTNDKPSCIKFFEADDFKSLNDGCNRACFVLAAFYANNNRMSKEDLMEYLKIWNRDFCSGKLTDFYIEAQVKQVFNLGRKMGCRFRKNLLDDLGMRRVCMGCPYTAKKKEEDIKVEEKKEEVKVEVKNDWVV